MLGVVVLAAVTLPLAGCPLPLPPDPEYAYKLELGQYEVTDLSEKLIDAAQTRDLEVHVYRPEGNGPFPAIILSPGLMLNCDHYTYLCRHWASYGYLVVNIAHNDGRFAGDNNQVVQSYHLAHDAWQEIEAARYDDVVRVVEQLVSGSLAELVDPRRIAVAGHSAGSYTAQLMIGLRPEDETFAERAGDARIAAALAMSPLGLDVWTLGEDSWDEIDRPCMMMAGSEDIDGIVTFDAEVRRDGFAHTRGPDQFMVTMLGASHYDFDDTLINSTYESGYHDYVCMISTAFFDAYLNHNVPAWLWLCGTSPELGSFGVCTVEVKNLLRGG